MTDFPPTYIIRHTRENLKKCTLQSLTRFSDFQFFNYPACAKTGHLPDLSNYVLLDLTGPPLTQEDSSSGLIVLDGTWRLAQKMYSQLPALHGLKKRSIPSIQTAYPRRQDDCPDPEVGLASIEALYIACLILKRNPTALLNDYYWKDLFLQKNQELIERIMKI